MPTHSTGIGNEFRDSVASFMRAAGFDVVTEVQLSGKNVDIVASRKTLFGEETIVVETKFYAGVLPVDKVQEFCNAYSNIINNRDADKALLLTTNDITPAGKQAIKSSKSNNIYHYTWSQFKRTLFGADGYMKSLIREHDDAGISEYYIAPRDSSGQPLDDIVNSWLEEENPPPLVIMGGYGTGKSTYSQSLARRMAEATVADPAARIPILVPLGEISEENSLSGLFGKLLADRYRIDNYHFEAVKELNRLGCLLIIFDGLDEMKHGMTFSVFERECLRLFELHEGNSRILLLGRPNAFPTDREFKSVIKGLIPTSSGDDIAAPGRPECRDTSLGEWTEQESDSFVRKYFRWNARKAGKPAEWSEQRLVEITDHKFKNLIKKPVHAQMLCKIALNENEDIESINEFRLYDRFIALLLNREIEKKGRHPSIGVVQRRRFNAAVSWWLLTQGGSSSTTIFDVPYTICRMSVSDAPHDLDDEALRRELISGCLVEKDGGTVYFGHRSIQEFLAAEYLFQTNFLRTLGVSPNRIREIVDFSSVEVSGFLYQFMSNNKKHGKDIADSALRDLSEYRGNISWTSLSPFIQAYLISQPALRAQGEPWLYVLRYLSSWIWIDGTTSTLYLPRSYDEIIKTLMDIKTPRDVWLIAAQLLLVTAPVMEEIDCHTLLAAMFLNSNIGRYVSQARGENKYVVLDPSDFRAACLVHSLRDGVDENSAPCIYFSFSKFFKKARQLLGYGPDPAEGSINMVYSINEYADLSQPVEPQRLYKLLNWSDRKTDEVRPFFNDRSVRKRMYPVEVTRLPKRPRVSVPKMRAPR